MKIIESCGGVSEDASRVATSGINSSISVGAPEYFFWTPSGVSIPNASAAKDIDTFNDLVKAANGVYLGRYEVESTGSEREVFENNFFGLKKTTTAATKTLQLTAPLCACTSAELEKMNGRSGRIFEMTGDGYLLGRANDDGSISGFPVSNMYKAINDIATTDTPVSNTRFEIPYSDPRGDQKNPAQLAVDWNFSEVDQPISVEAEISSASSNGTNLTFTADLTKDCSSAVLAGALKADFKVTDANGAEITTFTVTETSGSYAFDVTTDESVVWLETAGIVEISSSLYTMDEVKITTA